MSLRAFTKTDMPRMMQIENTVSIVPWGEEAFKMCFSAGHQGWVIEDAEQLIGFIIVSLKTEECHILNLCVDRSFQRQGHGRTLLDYALEHAKQRGVGIAYLEVRRSNASAIALYHQAAFHLIGERKDYYPTVSGHEDALVFAKSLQPVSPF